MSAAHDNSTAKRKRRIWRSLPAQGSAVLVVTLLLSLAIHLLSGSGLVGLGKRTKTRDIRLDRNQVKVRIVQTKKPELKPDEAHPESMPRILETPQTKTERPKEASHVGNVDHKTEKETRVSNKQVREKAADAGNKGRPDAVETAPKDPAKPHQPKPKQEVAPERQPIKTSIGSLPVEAIRKPRNKYEALLPSSVNDLPGQMNAGYKDFVDDKIDEGDRIDINTTEYRYIGYFTTLRKAIELVWIYPMEASRRGMQGAVSLEFAINKDGQASRIRVLKSSGYDILDAAAVNAVKLASPFAPLPDGFGRDRIIVTGSFQYVLTAYGSH